MTTLLPEDHDDLFASLVAESEAVADLDLSQVDGWVSGLLGSWRSDFVVPDPGDVDRAFVNWCRRQPGPVVAVLAERAAALVSSGDSGDSGDARDAGELGAEVVAQGAWIVRDPQDADASHAAIIEFVHSDDSVHCLLGEVSGSGELLDLRLAPSTASLLPVDEASDDPSDGSDGSHPVSHLDTTAMPPSDVAELLSTAWRKAAAAGLGPEPEDGLLLNQLVARSRLWALAAPAAANPGHLPELRAEPAAEIDRYEGMSEAEVREADQYAAETLIQALQPLRGVAAPSVPTPGDLSHAELVAEASRPLVRPPAELSHRERSALAFLEWADWIGAVLGAVRAGPAVMMSGSAMVDWVNRCPEVSSTIARQDRDWIEYGFDVALGWWADLELIVDGRLTDLGWWVLPRAAMRAWGADFDAR